MFGASTATKGLSFAKILTGINKTLTIANQVIPLYQQAKPMIQNAKSAFRILKEFSGNSKVENKAIEAKSSIIPKEAQKKTNLSSSNSNNPVFFV